MALYKVKLPKFSELSDDQKIAVGGDFNSISIIGSPGTGKSVVSVWRHIYNLTDRKIKSLLLTYTKTLEEGLRLVTKSEIDEKKLNIDTNVGRSQKFEYNIHNKPNYDEIIVDEAQDNACSFYESLKSKAKIISYGADGTQILYPDRACNANCFNAKDTSKVFCKKNIEEIKIQCLHDLFPENEIVELSRNYRNTYEIMCFVKSLFPSRNVISYAALQELKGPSEFERRGPKPVYYLTDRNEFNEETGRYEYSNEEQDSFIKDIIDEYHSDGHNIVILVPFQNEVDPFYQYVSRLGYDCSKFNSNMDVLDDIKNIHVTTFKSAKGLEFDTVIIPNFQKINNNLSKFNIEENDYYVAVTRAKINLFVIACSMIESIDEDTYDNEINSNGSSSTENNDVISIDDDLPF